MASSDEWLNHCSSSCALSSSSFLRVSSRYFSSTTSSFVNLSTSVSSCFQACGCSGAPADWRPRAVIGMNRPAANKTSAPSGGTNRRGHCQAMPASILSIGAGHGATPARAAESEFLKRIAASILTSDCSGFSNLRAAQTQQASANTNTVPPMAAISTHVSSCANSRRTTNRLAAPTSAAISNGADRVSSHQAKFTFRATSAAFDCQWSRLELPESDLMPTA